VIAVHESNEALVDIREACPGVVLQIDPLRQKNEKTMYARATVASMLATAQSYLPEGITFVLRDAWRPLSAQKMYFDSYYRRFQKEHPDWSERELYRYTANYAIPSDQPLRAGHMTGAAIDLSLFRNGRRLAMSSKKLPFGKRAYTDSVQLSDYINRNRQLLKDVMERASFVNYPKEFWHYSYGDTMWAELTNSKTAIYGPIEAL